MHVGAQRQRSLRSNHQLQEQYAVEELRMRLAAHAADAANDAAASAGGSGEGAAAAPEPDDEDDEPYDVSNLATAIVPYSPAQARASGAAHACERTHVQFGMPYVQRLQVQG